MANISSLKIRPAQPANSWSFAVAAPMAFCNYLIFIGQNRMSRIAEKQDLRSRLGEVGPLAAGKSIKKIDKYLQKYRGKINIQWVRAHTRKDDTHSINNAKAAKLANRGADIYGEKYLIKKN